jgi:hypothetical protein
MIRRANTMVVLSIVLSLLMALPGPGVYAQEDLEEEAPVMDTGQEVELEEFSPASAAAGQDSAEGEEQGEPERSEVDPPSEEGAEPNQNLGLEHQLFLPQIQSNGEGSAPQGLPTAAGVASTSGVAAAPAVRGDFDNDGNDDLAIAVRLENLGAIVSAGAVNVLYGTEDGLATAGNQFWHQDRANVEDAAQESDYFGSALAVGDFNADGFDDLAIGAPGEDVGAIADAGAVNVLYGSAAGLSPTAVVADQFWHQDVYGILGEAESDDFFGFSLYAGDFDGNGFDDLVIGVINEDVGAIADAGAVNVLYGVPGGLNAVGDQVWHQDVLGVLDVAESGDRFGY